ncbi:MAG: hypothetical protein NT120_04555 [Candidatus Aenigmarchaeota archaeon]|nr:hypothetical protein [Candidatus Aenigmarchaeota archaeon]
MELSFRVIITSAIVILVLVVMTFFIGTNSGEQITKANANSVFNSLCQNYKSKQCDWSVTRETTFSDFLKACRVLYGDGKESYSCLYNYCPACKIQGSTNLVCSSICERCRADSSIGTRTMCCQQYSGQCTGTTCDAC